MLSKIMKSAKTAEFIYHTFKAQGKISYQIISQVRGISLHALIAQSFQRSNKGPNYRSTRWYLKRPGESALPYVVRGIRLFERDPAQTTHPAAPDNVVKTASYWLNMRWSNVRFTSNWHTWCQYDFELTPLILL